MKRHCLSVGWKNIAPDDKVCFKDVIHMVPQWRLNVTFIVKYLINIYAPVAKRKIHYITVTPTDTNHELPKFLHPIMGACSTGATSMLICNYVVEQCLINDQFGFFLIIVYLSPNGKLLSGAFLSYVVVDFPNLLVREDHKFCHDKPLTWAPIPMDKFQCEKYCYFASTIQLRVFKSIDILQLKGVCIRLVNDWDNMVVTLPVKHINNFAGYRASGIFQVHIKGNIYHMRLPIQLCHCWGLKGGWSD